MSGRREIAIDKAEETKRKYSELINKFAKTNLNLSLCKLFLQKLIDSDRTSVEVKREIKQFLETINE